jgi:hypothetical protein
MIGSMILKLIFGDIKLGKKPCKVMSYELGVRSYELGVRG